MYCIYRNNKNVQLLMNIREKIRSVFPVRCNGKNAMNFFPYLILYEYCIICTFFCIQYHKDHERVSSTHLRLQRATESIRKQQSSRREYKERSISSQSPVKWATKLDFKVKEHKMFFIRYNPFKKWSGTTTRSEISEKFKFHRMYMEHSPNM